MTPDLSKPVSRIRGTLSKGLKSGDDKPAVVRDGGDNGAGMIRGMAVITRGEALGHYLWIDSDFLGSAAKGINDTKSGIKARFTHPSLSGDGLGKFLGRVKNGRVDGDIVRGDLHFSESATKTPDGDLADYIMTLAESDPEAFATSIVFESDRGAEDRYRAANTDKDGIFKSPDKDNTKNYRHARLSKLWADDIVDEPAANPGGIFHRGQEIPEEADELLSYSLGLTKERPELVAFDIDPDRVAGFVTRFLAQHGLEIKETRMSEDNKPEEAKPAPVDLGKERLAALKSKYSADPAFVLEMFEGEKTMAEAETEWLKRESNKKDAELAALREENKKLKTAAPAKPEQPAGAKPVGFSGEETTGAKGDFMTQAQSLASEKKIPLYQAMNQLATSDPELYAAHKDGIPVQKAQPGADRKGQPYFGKAR